MNFDRYLRASFQNEANSLRVIPRAGSHATSGIVTKTTPDFHSSEEHKQAASSLQSVPIRGINRLVSRRKKTGLDGLSVNLKAVRGEAHWNVPSEAGTFYLEVYFVLASKTQINLYQAESKAQSVLLKLEEERALVGIEIKKNPPIETAFTIYVNGIKQENVLKFAPQDCQIIIKAKKGFAYANPFILQPAIFPVPTSIIPSFASSHLSTLLRRTDSQCVVFNKSELPADKEPANALIDKYMLTNGTVNTAWINKTELLVTLSHKEDYVALKKTNGAKGYPLINDNASVVLERFLESDESRLLSGFSTHFSDIFPSLSDNSGDQATELIHKCGDLIQNLAPNPNPASQPENVQFFVIADRALPSLVVKKGVLAKSVPMKSDGTYDLEGLHFGEPPRSLDDPIKLHLELESLKKWFPVFQHLLWMKVKSRNILGALLIPFLEQLVSVESYKDIYMTVKYRDAILFFQTLLSLLQRELSHIATIESHIYSKVDQDQEKLNTASELPFYQQPLPGEEGTTPPTSEAARSSTPFRDFNFYQVIECTRLVAQIQDQLFAYSQSVGVGADIKEAWGSALRLHTAFGRLASFTSAGDHIQRGNGFSHSSYALAEAGLVAVRNQHTTSYRLWTCTSAYVSQTDLNASASVPEAIKCSHSHLYEHVVSRLQIPLAHTAKYLPAVSLAKTEGDIHLIKTAPNLPFLLVGYSDMTIAVINAKLRLMPLFQLSLKTGSGKKPGSKKEGEQDQETESRPQRSKSEKKLDYGSEEDDDENEGVGDLLPEDQDDKPEEKPFEVNKDILNNMVSMGFDLTLSAEALKKCNNQSIQAAIDAVIEIQNSIEQKFKTLTMPEAPPPPPQQPAPKLSEQQAKRLAALEKGRLVGLDLLPVSMYVENTIVKYKLQAVIKTDDAALVFHNSLQYHPKVVQSIGELHKDEALNRVIEDPEPRFDLETILPLYEDSLLTLVPLFSKIPKPLFDLRQPFNAENNFCLIENVAHFNESILSQDAHLLVINEGKELVANLQGDPIRVPLPQNLIIGGATKTHIAGLFSGDIALFALQSLKEPLAVFPLENDPILSEIAIKSKDTNFVLEFQSGKGLRRLLAQKVEDMFSLQEEGKVEESKESDALHITQEEHTIQAALHSLETVEVTAQELSPYQGDGKKKVVHFKEPTRLSRLEVMVAFESQALKGEHVTHEVESTHKYQEQILALYPPVVQNSDHPLALKLVAMNGVNVQQNTASVLSYPKIASHTDSGELESNPYYNESDKDFLFEHFDGHRMLVSMLKFYQMFEWSNTTLLIYTGDSIAEMYEPIPDNPDIVSQAHSMLQNFKSTGATPLSCQPVAVVRLSKNEGTEPSDIKFPLQVKRPARYLRVRVVEKNSKQGSRFLTNTFQAYGSETELHKVGSKRHSEYLPTRQKLNVQLTLKKESLEGVVYEEVKLDPQDVNIQEVLTPERVRNQPISKLLSASDSGTPFQGKIVTLSHLSIPLNHSNIIGVKAWLEGEDQEEKETGPTPLQISLNPLKPKCEQLSSLREQVLFGNLESLIESCLAQRNGGILLLLRLLGQRPELLSQMKVLINPEQIVSQHILKKSHSTADIWVALELLSHLTDYNSLKELCAKLAKEAMKLQSYITEQLSSAGVHFLLTLFRMHLHEAHNLEYLDILQAVNSLIFTKFSAKNPDALSAFKKVWETLPLDASNKVSHCVVASKLSLQDGNLVIQLEQPSYVEDIVLFFAQGDKSSSHFPDSAFLSASLIIDQDDKAKIARQHFVGVCDSYTLKVKAYVTKSISLTHVSYPQHPTLELKGIRATVFGFSKVHQQAESVVRYRYAGRDIPEMALTPPEEAAVETLPRSPKTTKELAQLLEQARSVADYVSTTIEESIGNSSMELTQKHAEKCFSLWLQLPGKFHWPAIEQKIQQICKTVFSKVAPAEAANVSLAQLRSVLIKGKSSISHKALLRLVESLQFQSNFIYAYMERYINSTALSYTIVTNTQLNTSSYKQEMNHNFLFLYSLVYLGEKLPYSTDKNAAIFQQQSRLKMCQFSDISLPFLRPQKNKIIANTLRCVLELRSTNLSQKELTALLRLLLLSLISGMKSEMTEAAKYLYGDQGRGEMSLMVRLLQFTLKTADPELKMLMHNLCSQTKGNSNLQGHVDGPVYVLNKLKLPQSLPTRGNVADWLANVRYLMNLIQWKSSSKVIDYIYSLIKLTVSCSALQKSQDFWSLMVELVFHTRSHIAQHLMNAITFVEQFFIHAAQLKTEYSRISAIITTILVDQKRQESSSKSKLARLVYRSIFKLLEDSSSHQDCIAVAGLTRQIFASLNIPLPEERAVVLYCLVTKVLNRISKWSLDDPACANSVNAIYSSLAYQIFQKLFFQKDPEQASQICSTVLQEHQVEQLAHGLVKWFFLTQELKEGKEPNAQEHQVRIVTDGLYRLYITLCHSQVFRRKAMQAVIEAVKVIDTTMIDDEIAVLPSVQVSDHACSIFGGLLRLTIGNKADMMHFLQDIKGYQFLEQRLRKAEAGLIYETQPQDQEVKVAPPSVKSATPGTKTHEKTKASQKMPSTPVLKSKRPEIKPKSGPRKEKIEKAGAQKTGKESEKPQDKGGLSEKSSQKGEKVREKSHDKVQGAAEKAVEKAEEKRQSGDSDLFEDESMISVKSSGQYLNLSFLQIGETVDSTKSFAMADIKVENIANRKLTKIDQRSSSKYNKDFNWFGDGWTKEGTHTGLAVSYHNERSLSFSLQATIELTTVMIGFPGILSTSGTNRPLPPAVTMNFGLTEDMRHSVRLERLEDVHFGSTVVYGVNLNSIPSTAKSLTKALDGFRRLRARYINFSVERGYYFGLRQFVQQKLLTQNSNETLKFLEINGYPIVGVGNHHAHIEKERQTSTLSFIAQLVKDKRLKAAQALSDLVSALQKEMLQQFVVRNTSTAIQFLLALVQDAPDQTGDEVLILIRNLILSENELIPGRQLQNFAVKVALNLGSEMRPQLQSVIQKVPPFINAVIKNIHAPEKRPKIELLSKIASSILMIASKEHTFSDLPEPLQLQGAPSVQDIFTMARHVESSEELMELFTIFLNPPLGLRIVSFKQPQLCTLCTELEEDPESRVALIRSLMAASDGAQAIEDFSASQKTLLGDIDELLANKGSQDTLLISKLHEWTERDQIRRKLVKEKAGIALYEILKSNYGNNEEREDVVNKVVQCIKRLVYGFPAAEEELAEIILQDDKLFQESNKHFNKHVLFPLLFGEETVSLTINPFFSTAGRRNFLSLPDEAPIPLSNYAKSLAQDGFPFITSILQPEQKRVFSEFLGSNLTTAQLLAMQFFKTGSEYSLSENNFSTNSALIAFGCMFQKQQNITYTCGLVSTTSVEGIMNGKVSPSSQTYLLIYTDEPRYIHIRLKPTQKKSLFFKVEKKHYFPSKENYIFKLEPGSHSSSDPLMLSFSPRKPNAKEESFTPIESDQFKALKWPGQGISIPLKISSGTVQSLLQIQNALSKLKSYQFANPFFERATQPLDHFSFMEKAAVTENPWHDVHNDFVARLNPKWRIPKGASLRYVIQQLFSVKYPSRPQNSLALFMHGRPVDAKATLGEVLSMFNEIREQLHPQQESKEEIKEYREGMSLGGTMELQLDVSNLLKIYYSELPSGSGGTTVKKVYKKWASKKMASRPASKEEPSPKEVVETPVEYIPEMGLFQCFSKAAGFNKIVQLLRQKLSGADPKKVEEVTCWLEEIENFSQFPSFETLLLKNKDCRDFFLEDVMRSDNIVEKFMARKDAIGNVPFETLSSLFTSTPDAALRQMALEKNILKSVLKNVEILTKEKPRQYDPDYDPEEEERKQQEKHEAAMKEAERKKKEEESKKNIEKVKRKGVGYVTNEGQVWNIQKYMNDREARNERVASFLNLIASLFDSEDWSPEPHHVTPLLQSCLLPLMESSFSAGSLVNLVKDYPLVMAQFHMVCVFARHRETTKLLLRLDSKYVPQQMISINELLDKLRELSDIFLGCLGQQQQNMKSSDSVAENKAEELARAIQDTSRTVEKSMARFGLAGDESAKLFDALSLPLPQAYIALLKNLRFDYMELDKKDNKYVHFYESNASQELVSPPSKMVRLAQELADLSTALPIDHTNAIFVRVDRERIDLMKAIIFGANGTPYAHGAFQYDLYLPQKYPDVSPKCNLTTTGGGQVRFNPNLYSSGKVCLSLLGTWRGNANENWDPKVSTILQVLLSIQAVVMSEEVYFNEPGYENTAGTPDGERKNQGYSNIVKYANIKFAMVEAIRKPPKGFETVVRRHFYLKRDQILKEVKTWIPMAEKNEANYTGLVSSHNWKWCELFKKEKLSYKEHLVQVIEELEKELFKLEPPTIKEMGRPGEEKKTDKKKAKEEKVDLKAEAELLDNIDVADQDEAAQQAAAKEMDISDEKVKDRWSRYIGAMGVDAVAKQAAARVLVSGAGAVGIQIAKNMVLAGCKVFTLHDVKPARCTDLSGQFFLANKDIGKNRAVASVQKLQQLNYYVKVGVLSEELEEETIKAHDVVILTDPESVEQIIEINRWCRKHKVKFLLAESVGLFGRMFADFGEKFPVLDKNGEELQDIMVNEIKETQIEQKKTVINEEGKEVQEKQKVKKALVQVLTGTRHNYEDGDQVEIREVQGMKLKTDAKKSINGECFKVTVISPEKFILEGLDLNNFTPYQQNGICKQLKQKIEVDFKTFEEAVLTKEPAFDMNLYISDFEKMAHWPLEHAGMMALTRWKAEQGGGLPPQSEDDVKSYLDLANQMVAESDVDCDPDKQNEVLTALALTSRGVFNPLCAFMGGVAAQECVKAITNKFSPLKQLLYFDSIELLPKFEEPATQATETPKPKQVAKEEQPKPEAPKEQLASKLIAVKSKLETLSVSSVALKMEKEKQLASQEDEALKLQELTSKLAQEVEMTKKIAQEQKLKLLELQKETKEIEELKKIEEDSQSEKPKSEKPKEEEKKQTKDYLAFWTQKESLPFKHQYENSRSAGLANSVGVKLTQAISKVKLFMVGAGAIGCELLKNYAMLNIGTTEEGLIVLTDPDHIEVSNLNRQFLFREKHLRKPKASTAAAAAIAMNPYLKGRIYARLDKVFPGTEHIFTDKFFKELSVVTNALDNIQARRYVDQRCVTARTPLLESGTLGPKGHIQVVLPGKTQSYGSQADPENANEIPHCTLKMFPQETLHCVEWARDLFGKLFTQNPQNLARVLEPEFLENGPKDSADLSALRKAVKMLRKRPTSWEQCVEMARAKFQKHFINDVKQLLHVYPLDKKTKEGKPFWASPKRPPHETPFNEKSELHISFIVAFASLTARIYGLQPPKKVRSNVPEKEKVAEIAVKAKVAEFKLDQKKLDSIAKEVESEKKSKEESKEESKGEEEEEDKSAAMENVPELMKELQQLQKNLPQGFAPKPEQFEKDDDENGHIDFIHSLANCRSANYKLEPMSWINVKLKAGRIVPALATTTAAVSGLQTLELVKLVKGCTMEQHRNVFLNLALPSMTASEPGEAEVVELREGLKVTLWDRWEVKGKNSLGQLMQYLEEEYKLKPQDVMKGNKALYMAAIMAGKEEERKLLFEKSMKELSGEDEEPYVDLTVTFTADGKILKGVPPVRFYF